MSSCEFFQMEERTSSDAILEEELHTINWQEVDTYPVFKECSSATESKQLECFTEALHKKILHGMQRYAQTNELDSVVKLNILITIDTNRNLSFTTDVDSLAFHSAASLKRFNKCIQDGLDSLEVVEPSFKRGIPVTTEFALPIIFTQENE